MAYDSIGESQPRLLPEDVDTYLASWSKRALGFALLLASLLLWLSLVTWKVTDPSLTNAVGGATRNLLGAPGAVISDLMLQVMGLGCVVVLLGPIVLGMELLFGKDYVFGRFRPLSFVFACLVMAGGLASLPKHQNWPLEHGFGGFAGGLIYDVSVQLISLALPLFAAPLAGLILLAGGVTLVGISLGFNLRAIATAVTFVRGRQVTRDTRWRHSEAPAAPVHGAQHVAGFDVSEPVDDEEAKLRAMARRYAANPPRDAGRDETAAAPRSPARAQVTPRGPDEIDEELPRVLRKARAQSSGAAFDDTLQLEPERHADLERREPMLVVPNHVGQPDLAPAAPVQPVVQPLHDDDQRAPAAEADLSLERAPEVDAADTAGDSAISAPAAGEPARPSGRVIRSDAMMRARAQKHQRAYQMPATNLLTAPKARAGNGLTEMVLRGNARLLEDTLSDFGIKGVIRDIRPGPVITQFAFEPARGVKAARVIGLADDIARSMSAPSARIAVISGTNMLGIELPNPKRETVTLREVLETTEFRTHAGKLPIALGKGIDGKPISADLAAMPHLLVAGTTGSGKSVGVNAMILSLLFRHTPEHCRLLLIDPKMLELSVYNGIAHLLTPVVTDPAKAIAALNWAVREMEERYRRMADLGVRNIGVYNNRVRHAAKRGEMLGQQVQTGFDPLTHEAVFENRAMAHSPLPYIVIVVDEFADLMSVAGKEIEAAVQRLAQMARTAGIHLVMATQRPSVDIVTGTIKANFPSRIGFKVASKVDSRTIIDAQGAEQLLGQGDMLVANGGGQVLRVHGAFVSDGDVEAVADALRANGPASYVDGITDAAEVLDESAAGPGAGSTGTGDDLYARAVAIVMRDRKASTSYLQRRLTIGYNRAASLIERMEHEGLIGPALAGGKREILADGGGQIQKGLDLDGGA